MRISDWSSDVCSSDLWASVVAFVAMSVIALFPDFYQGLYDRLTGGWGHGLTANQWLGTVIAIGVLKWIGMWLILRSEEHTSELQSLMRISYAVFCLKKKKHI